MMAPPMAPMVVGAAIVSNFAIAIVVIHLVVSIGEVAPGGVCDVTVVASVRSSAVFLRRATAASSIILSISVVALGWRLGRGHGF